MWSWYLAQHEAVREEGVEGRELRGRWSPLWVTLLSSPLTQKL